ncbi:TetR family transcriptional regulator [Deinococcus piscis]|uniref:TetR family transcriptional regulator n=1 Tax=Deinococcus piscis TaxID=394230 RepID=A0ABQ3K9T4_9DEIO|nr:TetR family transcriptional regulator [Deinococcus piscis]GHG08434.1 TetR family transcriptional regulator [Deinococcus piscis]
MPELSALPQLQPRKVPSQQRSKQRFETILGAAAQYIAAHGSHSLRMSDIAEQSGISIGSLYQYFPDKTALIATLVHQFQEQGHRCVQAALEPVTTEAKLLEAMRRLTQQYYWLYQENPALRNIWGSTQADTQLQALEAQDVQRHAQMLLDKLSELRPSESAEALQTTALLCMHLLNASVRLAITLPQPNAASPALPSLLAQFEEQVLPAVLQSPGHAI